VGSIQLPQEVAIVCLHREFEGLQSDAVDQVLQAVNKNAPGLTCRLDEEFQAANCFTELIRVHNGRSGTLHHHGSATHWTHKSQLGVIVPSPRGLTPAKRKTATLCPLDILAVKLKPFFFLECGRCRAKARSLHESKLKLLCTRTNGP